MEAHATEHRVAQASGERDVVTGIVRDRDIVKAGGRAPQATECVPDQRIGIGV